MSDRAETIYRLLTKSASRKAYIAAKLGAIVPAQIRALRLRLGMARQKDLAVAAGMHQSRISMFETPGANPTLDTLARLAAALKVGLIVKFVPFSEMLRWENEFSQDTFDVIRIDNDREFANPSEHVNPIGQTAIVGHLRHQMETKAATTPARPTEAGVFRSPFGNRGIGSLRQTESIALGSRQ